MKMCQAVWLSFGRKNISEVLAMRFARKVRETIGMHLTGMDCLPHSRGTASASSTSTDCLFVMPTRLQSGKSTARRLQSNAIEPRSAISAASLP
jgi:hypothetical protein